MVWEQGLLACAISYKRKHKSANTHASSQDLREVGFSNNGPGTLSRILTPITLNNGRKVNIVFGHSTDGVSADQEVSVSTINLLKEALNIAEQNLTIPYVPISTIYIRCTTNGIHSGPQSNHFRKTALDISRINGIPIVILGASEQVKRLQLAFDQSQNIRENFGPYLKHKQGLQHNVSGHADHIHVSVTIP